MSGPQRSSFYIQARYHARNPNKESKVGQIVHMYIPLAET